MRKRYLLILLLGIISLGTILRVIFLNSVPPALNIDEAALGYNAYSILKTGADEHGVFLPLALESFGDWKLPVYSYLAVFPISILGLNEFSTRLPSIFAGTIGIILIYFISQKLFRKKVISLFAAFFFSVSPWSIYFSRAAYEVNVATTIFLGGLLLFLHAKDSKKNKILLICSGFLFGITLFTYHSYIIFSFLFSLFLCMLYYKKIKKGVFFFLIPFFIFASVSFFVNYTQASVKFNTTTIFNDENILYERVNKFKKDTLGQKLEILDFIQTKYFGIPYQISLNYLGAFSPSFLFEKGGEKLVHNIAGFGNLYIFDALLIVLGLGFLLYNREKNILLLIFWLILAPIPSSLTLDFQNSTRLFILMPLFVLICAYGAGSISNFLWKKSYGKFILISFGFLFLMNVFYFFNLYFIHNQYHRAQFWKYGYKDLVKATNKYQGKKVVMQGAYDFPYIYFLFYNSFDPNLFRKTVTYYPPSPEGSKYVKEFGRYKFVPALADEIESPGILYIDTQNFNSKDNIIFFPNGDPIFKYYEKKE